MMQIMKFKDKILSLLLAISLAVAPLSGCDGQNGNQGAVSSRTDGAVIESNFDSSFAGDSQTPFEPSDDPSEPSQTPVETPVYPEVSSEPPSVSTEPVGTDETAPDGSITILNGNELTLEAGKSIRLTVSKSFFITVHVEWTWSGDSVTVDSTGRVTAVSEGDATVTASAGGVSDSIIIHVIKSSITPEESPRLPEVTVPREEIREAVNSYAGHYPAGSYEEAVDRTSKGQLSGYDFVPDQAPVISNYRPMQGGMYIKNSASYYVDLNTYVVIDAYGREVFRIYRGGAYITLEEVAAYVYAFGTVPANHSSSKSTKPTASIWGEYLRVNNTKFSGDTSRYPYEPQLPRISGCGGDLTYWEMDIGTTGTDCDPSYSAKLYNDGSKITRGAARLVYTWNDVNGNGMADGVDIIYVFYTYNHYNDFQEYLNYYGGWGEMFGNITGGGTISSKEHYNPTDYVPVAVGVISGKTSTARLTVAWIDTDAIERIMKRSASKV